MARITFAAWFCVALIGGAVLGADWTMFRGSDRNGVSVEKAAPTTWAADRNVKWAVKLPGAGNSSPIVADGRVFLACAEDAKGTRRSLYCFDRKDGKQLWVRTVPWDKPDPTHGQNLYCGSTPATDGERVVVWHGSAGVYCYDREGKELWARDLGTVRHIWGYAGSPVIHKAAVYLNCGPGVRTFATALDLKTGATLWQTDEPGGAEDKSPENKSWLGSWGTPVVAAIDGVERLLVPMPKRVNAYDLKTGEIVWTCRGTGPLAYTDVLVAPDGKSGVYLSGFGGPAVAFKLSGRGDVTKEATLWKSAEKPPQRIGSGVIVGQHVYITNEPGVACLELATGKELWKHRPGGNVWASIVAVGENLYLTDQRGRTAVFRADPAKYAEVAANEVGEGTNATIAVSDGEVFLRTHRTLRCIAAQ